MLYAEDVYAQRSVTIALAAVSVGFVIGGIWLLVGTGEIIDGLSLLVAGMFLAGIWRLFAVLHVKVEERIMRARFGPWGLTLPAEQIDGARAEVYRWGSYYGWGMRWGVDEGQPGRAMSVPFLRCGVIVETKQGARHYISSHHPEELASAVNRLARGTG
ncbi:MAG: hypothetical protein OXD50_12900 [Chloroflexi bacterium]|nr:hypothetical protein [Chloroflexota bacterium]